MAHKWGCPVSWLKPQRKVPAKLRSTYDRCAAAMQARTIWSYAVEDDTWLIKVEPTDEWAELTQGNVDALLGTLGVAAPVPSTPTIIRPQEVTHMSSTTAPAKRTRRTPAKAVTLPEQIEEYLSRLVHEPKREYAKLAAVAIVGGEEPPAIDAPWGEKVVGKLRKLAPAAA